MKIFINPGHDRKLDPGAVNKATGLKEADVAAEVGRHIYNILTGIGYQAEVMQDDDLNAVCQTANDWGADIFVSIHCNGFSDSAANGTETLYHPASEAGRVLAIHVQNQMVKEFGLYDRGIKARDGLAVLRLTDMPAVLAETAFITNPEEERLLASEPYRWAAAISRGITDYLGDTA